MTHALLWAAAGTGFTALMTAAGAAVVFFFRGAASPVLQRIMLGFAAGVMIASSMWSLLIPAIQQARELGRKVRESGVRIDEILYSPLSRAADTAKAVAEATGLPARCEPRLREQCFGRYEGTPRDGAEFRISKTHFADRYGDGESMMQLAQRIYNLLDELRQDEDKTYLLVAHNGIARVVESYFHDMTNEDYAAAGIKNCEMVEYRFE